MEKTIEEKWQAVKEFLLAKMGDNDGDDEGVSWDSDCGTWEAYWWKPNWKMKLELVDSRISEVLLTDHPAHLQTANIPVLYSLLGLDKRDALEAEKEKSKRWESRAWKILQIAKDKSMESFAHSIRIAKLEVDLAAVGKTEQNPTLVWEQTFKANPWDGVSVCATYMGLDFHVELQDDGRFEMSAMLHGALYSFGKVAIRQRAINQMEKIFNEMLQDPIDVMRIAERYAKD